MLKIERKDKICKNCKRFYKTRPDRYLKSRYCSFNCRVEFKKSLYDPENKKRVYVQWRKKYYARPDVKARLARHAKKYQAPNSPVRYKHEARWKLRKAVMRGEIKKLPCQTCGNSKSQGHHHDYYKPLEVTWLCLKCHSELHSKADKLEGQV